MWLSHGQGKPHRHMSQAYLAAFLHSHKNPDKVNIPCYHLVPFYRCEDRGRLCTTNIDSMEFHVLHVTAGLGLGKWAAWLRHSTHSSPYQAVHDLTLCDFRATFQVLNMTPFHGPSSSPFPEIYLWDPMPGKVVGRSNEFGSNNGR